MTLTEPAPPAPDAQADLRHVRRILCVDDDPAIRLLLQLNLAAEGLDVDLAVDGDDALTQLRAHRPDVIVLDVMMPGRDGYAVLEVLKSDEATNDIPVVLLTAKATDDEIWDGWRSGADYYITKPFDVSQLLYFVSQVLEGSDVEEGNGLWG